MIRPVVLMYVHFPLSVRNVEDPLVERGIDICHDTVRLWWNESYVTKTRHKPAALSFMKKALERHGSPEAITTDGLRTYGAS